MNITVKVTGPMFTGNPARVLSKAIDQVIITVSKVGVTEVKAQLYPGHGVNARPGKVEHPRGTFKKSIRRSKKGKDGFVFSRNTMMARWIDSGSDLIIRPGSFRGYQIFPKATAKTDRTAGEEARKITAHIVRQLGGR